MIQNEKTKAIEQAARAGFTLIEILLVVAIIGILAALAAPKLTGKAKAAKITAAKVDIDSIGTALDMYELDNGQFPPSLQALVSNPGGKDSWNGPYLKKGMPKDPWKNDYIYRTPGTKDPNGYDLKSMGPDGMESGDDISNYQQDG
jgi:general secretion pathway protein G